MNKKGNTGGYGKMNYEEILVAKQLIALLILIVLIDKWFDCTIGIHRKWMEIILRNNWNYMKGIALHDGNESEILIIFQFRKKFLIK